MRTKAFLLAAAFGAAGALTSMAQVYSVNGVGYINLTNKPGLNLIANQLNKKTGGVTDNHLNRVLSGNDTAPGLVQGTLFQKYNPMTGNFSEDIWIDLGSGPEWADNVTGNPATTTLSPGEGGFLINLTGSDMIITLTGDVPEAELGDNMTVSIPNGLSVMSVIVPQRISLVSSNNFPVEMSGSGNLLQRFNANTQAFENDLIHIGDDWFDNVTGDPVNAAPEVGQAFFFINFDPQTPWTRNFNL